MALDCSPGQCPKAGLVADVLGGAFRHLCAGFKLLESIPDFWIKCPSPVLMLRRSFSTKCCQHFNFSLSPGLLMLTHPLNVSLNNYTVTFQRYFMVCVKFQNIYTPESVVGVREYKESTIMKKPTFKNINICFFNVIFCINDR